MKFLLFFAFEVINILFLGFDWLIWCSGHFIMILSQNMRCYQANDKLDYLKTPNFKKIFILHYFLEFCSIFAICCSILQNFVIFCSNLEYFAVSFSMFLKIFQFCTPRQTRKKSITNTYGVDQTISEKLSYEEFIKFFVHCFRFKSPDCM
jgi:hypothetical protein